MPELKINDQTPHCSKRFSAWRRLPNEKFKVRRMFMAAFAKPLLCAGRFISTKFNLKTMILLTILNTIAILGIFFKLGIIKVTIRRDETFWNKTLMGYDVWVQKVYFRIPIRNKRKTELSEEVQRMIAEYDNQSKLQTLSAKFSWLKTWEQVKQFEKDYSVVDRKIVERLVAGFVPKQ